MSSDQVPQQQPDSGSANGGVPPANDDYPEQRHAGAVGYGPAYKQGVGMEEKMTGLKEQVKGKITRNPGLVQHGKDLKSGALKKKEQEEDNEFSGPTPDGAQDSPMSNQDQPPPQSSDENPAAASADDQPRQQNTSFIQNTQGSDQGAQQQSADTAPEGTQEAEGQRQGADRMRNIG